MLSSSKICASVITVTKKLYPQCWTSYLDLQRYPYRIGAAVWTERTYKALAVVPWTGSKCFMIITAGWFAWSIWCHLHKLSIPWLFAKSCGCQLRLLETARCQLSPDVSMWAHCSGSQPPPQHASPEGRYVLHWVWKVLGKGKCIIHSSVFTWS